MSDTKGGKLEKYYYVIVSLERSEAINININIGKQIINDCPTDLNYYDVSTNMVTLKFMEKVELMVPRYQLLDPISNEVFTQEMLKYIATAEQIRERLLITVFNYKYDKNMERRGLKTVVELNPVNILANVYEDDIDKILTVV